MEIYIIYMCPCEKRPTGALFLVSAYKYTTIEKTIFQDDESALHNGVVFLSSMYLGSFIEGENATSVRAKRNAD